jgi:hypothetical protein
VLLLLVLAWRCLLRDREIALGALLGSAALLKYPLGLFLFYLIAERRWRAAAGFLGCAIALFAASIAVVGVEPHAIWLREAILPALNRPVAAFNVQSLDAFLARLWTDGNLANWEALELGRRFTLVRYAVLALLLAFAVWAYVGKRDAPSATVDFSVVLCFSLILSPISWSHYYSWLLLPLSLCWACGVGLAGRGRWRAPLLAATLLLSLPVSYWTLPIPALSSVAAKLLASHYLLGAALLAATLLAARRGTAPAGAKAREREPRGRELA